jgi:hypothetical protein
MALLSLELFPLALTRRFVQWDHYDDLVSHDVSGRCKKLRPRNRNFAFCSDQAAADTDTASTMPSQDRRRDRSVDTLLPGNKTETYLRHGRASPWRAAQPLLAPAFIDFTVANVKLATL